MTLLSVVLVGFTAGLHGAMYGAYKDSPHESFLVRRCVRELVTATVIAAVMAVFHFADDESPFILYLSIFALTRIVTEFWKLFVRIEPQEGYRIPTQIHCVKHVVHNPIMRLILGFGFVAAIYGIWALCKWAVPLDLPAPFRGLLVGLAVGISEAIAGGYKDGAVEGFYWHKFAKSPVFGMLGGLIASGHTQSFAFLLLGAVGSMRMLLELVFKMVVPDYAPGKFRSMIGPHKEWTARRSLFLPPYALTWALYLVMASHPNW
jgi:hypothetical protein